METVLGILCLTAMCAFAVFIFRPILTRESPRGDGRFQLVDVFSLFVLWTYPLALVQAINAINRTAPLLRDRSGEYVALGLFEVAVTAIWMRLLRTLSQRGVSSALRRFMVIAIAVPLGIAATIGFTASLTATWMAVEDGDDLGQPLTVMALGLGGGAASHLIMRWAMLRRNLPAPSSEGGDSPLDTSDRLH
jgi:hypothetical protein